MQCSQLDCMLSSFPYSFYCILKASTGRGGSCPSISQMSCPSSSVKGDVIQLIPKRLPADHPIARRPEIASRETNLLCARPGNYSFDCSDFASFFFLLLLLLLFLFLFSPVSRLMLRPMGRYVRRHAILQYRGISAH